MQVLLYILLIEAFFVLLICNFMSKKFKINLLTLKDYKSKDSNNYRYYYNQLAIEIIKDIVGIVFISGIISVILDTDDSFGSLLLLGVSILLWIILCIYDFRISKTIGIREDHLTRNMQIKCLDEGKENSKIKLKDNNFKFNLEIRLSLIISGIVTIGVATIISPDFKFNVKYSRELNYFFNLYYPEMFLFLCGLFNWSFLSKNKETDILLDTIKLGVLFLGIPAIGLAIYKNSILWKMLLVIVLPLDVFFCGSAVISIYYFLRQVPKTINKIIAEHKLRKWQEKIGMK